ncbi:MAG: histidine kinase N-terminal 7TM domain-containing protein, partial [Candidatus Fermentibacteria bacterium]|nr:histidine kinase N-terminal 7TM domain-containing protein [Candidatus Fermentibacteria bacterium]
MSIQLTPLFISSILNDSVVLPPRNFTYSFLLSAAALVSFYIAIVAWRRRTTGSAASSLAVLMVASAWWGFTYAIHWAAVFCPFPMFWLNATYFGVVVVPTAYFVFALHFIGKSKWLNRRTMRLLAIEPILTLVILWTDRAHGLFFSDMQPANGSAILDGGFWFWLNIVYSYILILVAFVLLVKFALKADRLSGKQVVLILFGSLVPWVCSVISVLDVAPLADIDLTPFAFTITGAAFALALFRLNLLAIVPMARDALVEVMTDGFFVVDLGNRVVDINLAAQKYLGLNKASIGKNAEDLFRNTPDLVALYRDVKEGQFEFFTEYFGQRHLDMRVVPLSDHKKEYTGRLFIFRDITQRKTVEMEIKKANDQLKHQLSEIKTLQAELHRQAIRDPLTKLYNRRYLEESLEREMSRAFRENAPLSILMLDIDHFKKFNDTYGHRAGDAILRELGKLLLWNTRNGGDIACRYGGEEFVIVLSNTSLQAAQQRAEQFRSRLEEMRIAVGENELS